MRLYNHIVFSTKEVFGMSRDQTQVSAFIARETKARLDRYVAETGLKKSRVVEQALVPTEVVLTAASFDAVLQAAEDAGDPTPALRRLMSATAEAASTHDDPPAQA
jgi:hypothetical protein